MVLTGMSAVWPLDPIPALNTRGCVTVRTLFRCTPSERAARTQENPMPEYDDNGDVIDDDNDEGEGARGARRAQRATEAENKRLREELEVAASDRRELAATKAGLDPSDKTAAFFLKHYDGEPSVDAMRTAAIEAGVLPEVDAAAAASVAGQAQMASAFQGGEHVPLGTTTVGSGSMRREVPAAEAEKWQAFEAAVKGGDMNAGAEVLRQYGHQMDGIADTELLGGGGPQTNPI